MFVFYILVFKKPVAFLKLATNFVENLLAVHCKYTGLVNDMFNRDQQFQEALHKAFESVVNSRLTKNAPKSPEIIAKLVQSR